jgi:DNA repair exonuclease SbcCD ATPase subunit
MALFLAEQTTFPDLRNWEDSAAKIQDASKAVAELKALIVRQSEEVRSEREREAVRAKAREERETLQRQRSSLAGLMQRLNELSRQQGTASGGYAFQDFSLKSNIVSHTTQAADKLMAPSLLTEPPISSS